MSGKKNIEDWVKSNRDLFDDKELPVGHRELFEKRLNSLSLESYQQKKNNFQWYKIAVVFVVGIAIISSVFLFNKIEVKNSETASISEFEQIENQYSEQIKEALVPVRSSKRYLSPEYRTFLKEMEKLDVENEKLKEMLLDFPDDERILNSIIENYKSRLQLLEQLKQIISNKQISKTDAHDNI